MSAVWQFVLLGLGGGASYVLCAQGVVLIYRGSGVINFAQGAFALIGAYTGYELNLLGVPVVLSVVLGVLVSALAGAATHFLLIRRLSGSSQLTKVIATLGLFTLISSLFSLHFESKVVFPKPLLKGKDVEIFGSPVGQYALLLLGIAIVGSVLLWFVYRFSLFGLQTTAVAENPIAAAAQGRSPNFIAMCNWSAGAGLAGLSGALISPTLGLSVATISLLLVPSLAAALLGNFVSFGITCVAGLLLGIAESELVRYDIGAGWSNAVPFLLIVIVMVVRGTGLPGRSHIYERLPALGSGRIRPSLAIAGVVVAVVLLFEMPADAVSAATTTLVVGIVLLSSVVVSGYAGQISLAQWGLAGVGAYIAARTSDWLGWNWLLCIVVGALLALPIGFIVGLPALRARGVSLAIVTLGLGLVIETVLFGNASYTGGEAGILLPTPSLFGYDLDPFLYPERYAMVCLVGFVLVSLLVANLRRSQIGRRLIAVRGNERAAASLGISVWGSKLYAFTLSAAVAGLGGGLLVFRNSSAVFTPFTAQNSIVIITLLVMGGIGYIGGAYFAALVAATGVVEFLLNKVFTGPSVATWLAAAGGLGVLLTVLQAPDGISRQWIDTIGRLIFRRGTGERIRPIDLTASSSRVKSSDHVLDVRGLSVRFGGVVALDDVDLTVRSGEILGLIGPNGAGKTTLIDAVSGLTRRYKGAVSLDGSKVDRATPTQRGRQGIGRSFQSLELFEDLSVVDNLRVASERPTRLTYLRDLIWPRRSDLSDDATSAVRIFGLEDDLHRLPAELPYGRRRLVGIARAVAASPHVLLLDEPAAGLDEHESANLSTLLRALADDTGLAVLLIEHDMNLVMNVSDRIVALDFGRVIATGKPEDVRRDPAVITAYLGGPAQADSESAAVDAPPLAPSSTGGPR